MNDNQAGSIYQQIDEVKEAVSEVLTMASKLGATSAEAAMSRTSGLSVSTRMGEVDTIEFNQDGSLGISVYVGNKKGSASTADLSPDALKTVVSICVNALFLICLKKYSILSFFFYASTINRSYLSTP